MALFRPASFLFCSLMIPKDLAILFTFFTSGMVALLGILPKLVPKRRGKPVKRSDLSPSLKSGWYGGMLGRAVAGVIIVPFSVRAEPDAKWWVLIPLVFGYSVLVGFSLGTLSQLVIQVLRYLASHRQFPGLLFNEATGGALGGAFGGFLIGALGGFIFGRRQAEFVNPVLVVVAAVVGGLFVCGGTLLYEYNGRLNDVALAFFSSVLPTAVAATIGIWLFNSVDIGKCFFSVTDAAKNTQGGAWMGAIIGGVLGLQVGCTLLLYRLFTPLEKARSI